MKTYLASHEPPTYSLVLDSEFPVVVGEKSLDGLAVLPATWPQGPASHGPSRRIDAGSAPSIVPDRSALDAPLARRSARLEDLGQRIRAQSPAPGTRLEIARRAPLLDLVVQGRAAHAG